MHATQMTCALPLILTALAACAGPAGAYEVWWDASWEYRRPIEIKPTGVQVTGAETGVADLHTAGKASADKGDTRVTCDGRPVPCTVVQAGPGDFCRVAFKMKSEPGSYFVYFGNPKAPAPANEWEPERGLLLETRRYNGGDPGDLKGMREIIRKSGPSCGADFVPTVYHRWNLFAPDDKYVSVYKGSLRCAKEGEYEFSTSSQDGSFLLLDDKVVVEWPGWHGPDHRAIRVGKANLRAGVHKFEYLHVSGIFEGLASAFWKTPDQKRFAPIEPACFTPVARGKPGQMQARTGPVADFRWEPQGQAYMDEKPLIRWKFSHLCGQGSGPYRWDFGDGQKAEGDSVEHVYLAAGTYEIRLACKVGGRESSVAARLRVDQDYSRLAQATTDDRAKYAEAVAKYDWSAADLPSLLRGAVLMDECEKADAQIAIARAVLGRTQGVDDDMYFNQAMTLNFVLRDAKKDPDAAMEVLHKAEERLRNNKNLRAKVNREIGDVYYYYKNDLDRALLEYDKVVGRYTGLEDNIVRVTKIKIGDIFRERGRLQKAAELYDEAEKLRIHKITPAQEPMRQGYLVQATEDYLRRGEIEEAKRHLSIWEWEFPKEKLRGQSTLLRAQIAIQDKNDGEAIKQMETLVRVNPDSLYSGEMLFLIATLHLKAGDKAKAQAALNDLVLNHQESEFAERAAKKLKELGLPIPEPGKNPPEKTRKTENADKAEKGEKTEKTARPEKK